MKLLRLEVPDIGTVTIALGEIEACVKYRSPVTGQVTRSWIPVALLRDLNQGLTAETPAGALED